MQAKGGQEEEVASLVEDLKKLPILIEQALEHDKAIEEMAEHFIEKHNALFLGRGDQYPVAMEGALKLKEISYIHAEAYPAGELKHGPLALVDSEMPIVAVAPNTSLLEKLKSNLEEIIEMDEVPESIAPIIYTIPLQLLSYHVAVFKGTDVDKPRNLAKEWIGELKDTKTLKSDAIAGLTVALVLVPQSMAYAQLAGLPAYVGPVAIVSLMTAAALEPLAISSPDGYLAYAAILAFMVGVFQASLGLLRLGILVDFLSHPVVVGFESRGGAVIGVVPSGLPGFKIPDVEFGQMVNLIVSAAVIGLLGFVEAISVAKAIASETRQRLSANQELVGQGMANIVASMFQAYPVSGSFSRSAVNFAADAKTGFSSIVTGILVATTLLFLTPLLYHLPQATLAAVIMVAVFNLIKIEPIVHAWKVHRHDGFVAVAVFLVTLFFAPHLEKGIMAGVVLSLGLFLYRTMSPRFVEVGRHEDGSLRSAELFDLKTSDTVSIFRYDGDLYFANAGYLEGKVLNSIAQKPNLKVMVLDFESVDLIDSTGEETLARIAERLEVAGIELYIARAKRTMRDAFTRSGLMDKIGEDRFFRERTLAAKFAKENLREEIGRGSDVVDFPSGEQPTDLSVEQLWVTSTGKQSFPDDLLVAVNQEYTNSQALLNDGDESEYQTESMQGETNYGATANFVGTMRDFNEGDDVKSMTLEHYPAMTEKQLNLIVDQAYEKWPLQNTLISKLGKIPMNIHKNEKTVIAARILAGGSGGRKPESF
ncbi:Glutamine--fructose-6-phosphate aminotransferase [isomerizing] [Nymphon striatum]|nr:Glutamine--fructose-6-phosphate aminotransferase [isomerizing] [Nymphon striatum]